MTKRPNFLKRSFALLLATVMTFSVDLPTGTGSIWSVFDLLKTTQAATATTVKPTGDGTSTSPYQINSTGTLYWFADKVNSNSGAKVYAKLTADIDLNGAVVNRIGTGEANPFTGTFDGDGHTIKNYVITTDNVYDNGLFGYVKDGTIKNVTAYSTLNLNFNDSTNSNSGHAHSGFVAHLCGSSSVNNCEVHTTVKILSPGNYNRVAIAVANVQDTSAVKNCTTYGTFSSSTDEFKLANAGGVVGRLSGTGYVRECTNYAGFSFTNKMSKSTNASISAFGGVVGYMSDAYLLNYSTNKGTINITTTNADVTNIGGVVGYVDTSSYLNYIYNNNNEGNININTTRTSSSATNTVSYIGGIMGSNNQSTEVYDCVNKGNISISGNTSSIASDCVVPVKYVGGIAGGTPKKVKIKRCLNSGNITLTDVHPDQHGGIVGYCEYNIYFIMESCGNTGDITCKTNKISGDAGWGSSAGILGYVNNTSSGSFQGINNCYNAGTITSYLNNKGGIIGYFNGELTTMPSDCTNYYLSQEGVNGTNGTTITNMTNTTISYNDVTNGKLCYLLNNGVTDGTQLWYQTLETHTHPVFNGGTIYSEYDSANNKYVYKNQECSHSYTNGICSKCKKYQAPYYNEGSYKIYNAGQLMYLGYMNGSFTDATLMNDIDLTNVEYTSLGTEKKPYYGNFYGNGHTITLNQNSSINISIFGYANLATIKDRRVAGTINTSEKFAAGIVKEVTSGGLVTINNCISDVTINSYIDGDGTHGGIVGVTNGNLNINNCAFTGSISGSDTNSCGGIVGYANKATHIANSYMAGDLSGISSTNGNTFVRGNNKNISLLNCYYINQHNATPSGATQADKECFTSGEICYLLNNSKIDGTQAWYQTIGTDTYPVLDNTHGTVYENYSDNTGVTYTNTKYSCTTHSYENGICALCGDIEEPILTDNAYQLASYGNLLWFKNYVEAGNYRTNAKLTANITVNENLLNSEGELNTIAPKYSWSSILSNTYNKSYGGTFDGDGHYISGLYNDDPVESSISFFSRIGSSAVLKNLIITDSYFRGYDDVAPFVGYGGGTIENCGSNAIIIGQMYCGGILGGSGNDSTVITNCYYAGKAKGLRYSIYYSNAILSDYYNRGTLTNCYYSDTCGLTSERAASKTATEISNGDICSNVGYHSIVNGTCILCDSLSTKQPPCVNGYYQLSSYADLVWFQQYVDAGNVKINAMLTADITANENLLNSNGELNTSSPKYTWTPITQNDKNSNNAYKGIFDGNGHTISGLYYSNTNKDSVGLFGYINGTIKNLIITDSYFEGNNDIGTFSGTGYYSTKIENCGSTATVKGNLYCSGIVGSLSYNTNSSITSCYYAGKITTSDTTYSNAITDDNNDKGTLTNCYYLDTCGLTDERATAKTSTQFSNGDVCYNLNNKVTNGTQKWYQRLGVDPYPTLTKTTTNTVCYVSDNYVNNCKHKYSNGLCIYCNLPQQPSLTNGYYQLANYGHLVWFQQYVDAGNVKINAMLTADITANKNLLNSNGELNTSSPKYTWTPITQNTSYSSETYQGIFDGNGHTISGLYYSNTSKEKVGLFGIINGTIKNLIITDSYFEGNYTVGTFSGLGFSSTKIENCGSTATVKGNLYCGGIAGDLSSNTEPSITSCYYAGKITAIKSNRTGAITENDSNSGTLTNCYYLDTCGLTDERATAKTSTQFSNGDVCYNLNNKVTNGTQKWYQTIGKDKYPVLVGDTVAAKETTYFNPKMGDVNLDNNVDSIDAALVLKYVNNTYTLNKYQLSLADVDKNDKVDLLDAVGIMNK